MPSTDVPPKEQSIIAKLNRVESVPKAVGGKFDATDLKTKRKKETERK